MKMRLRTVVILTTRQKVDGHERSQTKHTGTESYDDDEEYESQGRMPATDARNSALAVGYNSDRSFVVRGDRIGVFKHTVDDNLG
jgi:hypothetical protein